MSIRHVLSVLLLCLSACNRIEPTPEPEPDTLSIEFSHKGLSNKSAEFTIDVFANCDWSFSVDSDWTYIIEPRTAYNGPKTLSIKVLKNDTTSERTATYSFIHSGGKQVLTITQAAFEVYLTASEHNLSFGYRTAEKIISISSNCGWEAKSSASWIAVKPITGLIGNFEMTINVETNNSTDMRASTIEIWNETYALHETINVSQNGKAGTNDKDYIDEYGINYGQGIDIRGLFWAPVNCGYHVTDYPVGKMYQWGRKTGIGYHDDIYNDTGVTLIDSIWKGENGAEEPNTFYRYDESSKYGYDWILNGDDAFWNKGTEENPIKNIAFDPCPDGWRIPTAFEFKSLIEYVNRSWIEKDGFQGHLFTQEQPDNSDNGEMALFLPAAGRLNAIDGQSYDRNIEGYYWTITADAGNSGYLFFYCDDCSVNYKGSRAGGCSIRCIKE